MEVAARGYRTSILYYYVGIIQSCLEYICTFRGRAELKAGEDDNRAVCCVLGSTHAACTYCGMLAHMYIYRLHISVYS